MNPEARLRTHVLWQGAEILYTWEAGATLPTGLPVRRVSGVCPTESGRMVPVPESGADWTLPGGRPGAGELAEAAPARELAEEACAEVLACPLLVCRLPGWQRVDETRFRRLVAPTDLLNALHWGRSPIAAELLRPALEAKRP